MLDIIKLLNEIADRECCGKDRRVPIIIAAMFNLTVTAMELIRDGVDVNEAGPEDKTALLWQRQEDIIACVVFCWKLERM